MWGPSNLREGAGASTWGPSNLREGGGAFSGDLLTLEKGEEPLVGT